MGFKPSGASPDGVTLTYTAGGLLAIKKAGVSDKYFASLNVAFARMQILELQAAAGLTPMTSASANETLDTFSAAAGSLSTVDTVNSTAAYDSGNKKYKRYNIAAGDSVVTVGAQNTSNGGQTIAFGYKIHVNLACSLTKVTMDASCTATRARLMSTDKLTTYATATFSGADAVFTPYAMTAGADYCILLDNNGSGYTRRYNGSASYPYTNANINVTAEDANTGGYPATGGTSNIVSITTNISGSSNPAQNVVCNIAGATGAIVGSMLVCNCPNRESGDSVAYNITDGTNTDSGLALNTPNSVTAVTGTPTKATIVLTGKSSSPTDGVPSVKTYYLVLFYSA